ncbi:PREDICTED: solute carrier family 17 member 9-like [Thamnophis sirtalis]|uniref:Solute carrier family 17 member 9-like n=1 Tax=Thamnophis sirtalis TaxID=35019 RepID=A0A6I9X6Z4_9SAUR|nr:PREDICTED: solute carrier family 17 member 9-like [Thamnophis sirtalis]
MSNYAENLAQKNGFKEKRQYYEDLVIPLPESRLWTTMLLLGTCLLYCARVLMPICVVTMSSRFDWDKKQSGIVLSSFFWGYCLTQVVGGHLSDRYEQYYVKSGVSNAISLSAASGLCLTPRGHGRRGQRAWPARHHSCWGPLWWLECFACENGLPSNRVYFPALASLLSQKVQESERALTYSTVGTGSQFGYISKKLINRTFIEFTELESTIPEIESNPVQLSAENQIKPS